MVILASSFNMSYWRLWLVILNQVLVWSRMRLRNSHVLFQTNDLCWENSEGLSTTPSWSPQSWSSTSHALQLSSLQLRSVWSTTTQRGNTGARAEETTLYWTTVFYSDLILDVIECLQLPENNSRSSPAQRWRSGCHQHASSTYEHGELALI